jgi:hypothetical protein
MKSQSRIICAGRNPDAWRACPFAGTRIVYRWVLTGIPIPPKKILIGRSDGQLPGASGIRGQEGRVACRVWPDGHRARTPPAHSGKENTVIRAECNIYNSKDEKLIWSEESAGKELRENGQGLCPGP